jgi:phage terminase large subunit
MNLGWYYRITDNAIINRHNGTSFIFGGLHSNAHEIKSKEGLTHAWIEEAENVSKTSWSYLEPTIRTQWLLPWQFWPKGTHFTAEEAELGGRMVDPELWVSFNPAEESDFIYQLFVGGEFPKPDFRPPPGAVVVMINWQDNPWFPENLRRQKDYLYATDPDGAEHIWGGKPRKQSAAQVLRGKYVVEDFEIGEHWSGPYNGTDWGFATDPTASVRCWIDERERKLYISHEAFEYHTETDDTPALLSQIPDAALYVNRADNARPETISYCRRHGHPRIVGVEKWPGSVEDGISYLRQEFAQIIIHPRCTHTIEEAKLWSYKVDKNTQDVLPEVEDRNNHCWDGVRYALAPLIRGGVKFNGAWWRRWSDLESFRLSLTIRMVTVTISEVADGAADLGAALQLWGVRAAEGMYLLQEGAAFGTLPEIIAELDAFWHSCPGASELWIDAKAVGATLLRSLRQKGIPAREYLPKEKTATDAPDMTVMDPEYRAKLASVHLAAGRVLVPKGPCAVVTEVEGLATNAMTLALLIWQQRGGGVGPIPGAA